MTTKPPARAPSTVIFDMGGVLIDWNPRHLYRKLIPDPEAMERFLAEIATNSWHVRQDHGGDPIEATRSLQARHPDKAELIGAFYSRFDEMLEHAIPGMAQLVEKLHAAKVPLVLLSNAPALLETWVRGTGRSRHRFIGLFQDYVVSGTVGCAKPQAEIYQLACRRSSLEPGEAVFIDDSLPNVEGARAAGLHAIHHKTADETAAALRAVGLPA
jgi:2-haloacid dehalogenase